MPRRPKRRPVRRSPQDRSEQLAIQRRRLDAAAQSLLDGQSMDSLRSELHDRELLLAEADRAAQMDPSPANLATYRMARSQLEAAHRAIELATGDQRVP